MPAWPTCARLLLFVVFSLFGQSGHFGPYPLHIYDQLNPLSLAQPSEVRERRSAEEIPKLLLFWYPQNIIARKAFSQRPRVVLVVVGKEKRLWKGPVTEEDGKPWSIRASKANSQDPELEGETQIPLNSSEVTFQDLRVAETCQRYKINFHLVSTMYENVTVSSTEFDVQPPYSFSTSRVDVKYREDGSLLSFNFTVKPENPSENITGTPWNYTVVIRNTHVYSPKLTGVLAGIFSQSPVHIRDLHLVGEGYYMQLTISTAPTDANWTVVGYTKPFDVIPPLDKKDRQLKFIQKSVASLRFNGSYEAATADKNLFISLFLNQYAMQSRKHVHWKEILVLPDPPRIEWTYEGRKNHVLYTASVLLTKAKVGAWVKLNNNQWRLTEPMHLNRSQYYGREGPPPEGELYIGGYRFVHIVLIIVLAGILLPVIFLFVTWRKRENNIQQRYQQRLMKFETEEDDHKGKKSKANGHANAGFDNVSPGAPGETAAADIGNNRPIFTVQDHMSFGAANSAFSPTEALPPARFRWSAPEKSGVVELTMAQLREQNHNFMEQGGLTFSRYKDLIRQKNNETFSSKQSKPFSAPVMPTLTKWSLPSRGSSHIIKSPLETASNKASGAMEVLHPSALPAPTQEVPIKNQSEDPKRVLN